MHEPEAEDYISDPLRLWFLFSGHTPKQKMAHAYLASEMFSGRPGAPSTFYQRHIGKLVDEITYDLADELCGVTELVSTVRNYAQDNMGVLLDYQVAKRLALLLAEDIQLNFPEEIEMVKQYDQEEEE